MSRHKLPQPLRNLAATAHEVLKTDFAKRKGASLTDLAELLYDRPNPGEIKQAKDRQTVPRSRRVLAGIGQVSPRAARLFEEWIPALHPRTPACELRRLFSAALANLKFSPATIELAKQKDLLLDRGAFRSQESHDNLSRFLLELITLRRLVDAAPVAESLEQGWYVALALLECIEDVPNLEVVATSLWDWIVQQYLPSAANAMQYGTSIDRRGIAEPFSALALFQRTYALACLYRSVSSGLPSTEGPSVYLPMEVPEPLIRDFVVAVTSLLLNALKKTPARCSSGVRYLTPLKTNFLGHVGTRNIVAIALRRQSHAAQVVPTYLLQVGHGTGVLEYLVREPLTIA